MLTGRNFPSTEAREIGLVVDVLPDDLLLEAAYRKADEVISNTAVGVALTKEAMWTALEIPGLKRPLILRIVSK